MEETPQVTNGQREQGLALRAGADLVHIPRIASLLKNEGAVARILTALEVGSGDAAHVAGVIAAKEALFKALGMAPPRWRDVEVRVAAHGRPTLELSPELAALVQSCDVSIAHDGDYAVAFVILSLRAP